MGHSGEELWVFLTLATLVWYNSVLTLGEEMENFEYKMLHEYTQRFLEAKEFVSETTGEDVPLSLSAKIVYLYLLGKMFDATEEFVIAQSTLADRLKMDTKTVAKALTTMLEHGAISGEKRLNNERGFHHWVYFNVHFPLSLHTDPKSRAPNSVRKKILPHVRFEVLRRNKFCCSYCGKAAVDGYRLVIDHIKPVSKGGTNDIDNLTASCDDCNNGKGTADIDSYTPPVFSDKETPINL